MSVTTRTGMHEDRVPVEHRLLGLDRRTIPYALVALAVFGLWSWFLPWVNSHVAWDDVIEPGDVIRVSDEVTMTAEPGWGVISGLRAADETRSGQRAEEQVVLVKNGVTLQLLQGEFDGSPARLLSQATKITAASLDGDEGFHVTGDTRHLTTATGLRGVSEGFSSHRNTGVLAAFVVDGTGIEVQVVGPADQLTHLSEEIDAMLTSLAHTPDATGDGSAS